MDEMWLQMKIVVADGLVQIFHQICAEQYFEKITKHKYFDTRSSYQSIEINFNTESLFFSF